MGDYVAFRLTIICGFILAVILQAVQGSPDCCTPSGNICYTNKTQCVCNSGPPPQDCKPSIGDGEICLECCYPNYVQCFNDFNGEQHQYCLYFRPEICRNRFFTFAQVALVCALATAFSALGAICWRICRGRHAASVSSLLRERESSLTSVQRFIIQRLRDRPPRYEDTNQIHLEKPPPYQEAIVETLPRSLSAPFFSNALPTVPNEDANATSNCIDSALNERSNKTEGENYVIAIPSVRTNENPVQQAEAVSVQNVQVNSDESTRENVRSSEQKQNFPEPFESTEIKLTEEQNVSLSSESKHGVDNPAFTAEEEITIETQASADQNVDK